MGMMTHQDSPPSSFAEIDGPIADDEVSYKPHVDFNLGSHLTQLDEQIESDITKDEEDANAKKTYKFTPLGLNKKPPAELMANLQLMANATNATTPPAGTADPSSFAETGYPNSFLEGGMDSDTEAARLRRRKMLNQMERAYGLPESHSFIEENAAKLTALTQRLHEQQDEAAYDVPVRPGEDPMKTFAAARRDLQLPG